MARPAAIWQTVEILQQPVTRNQQIRKVHGLSPTALLGVYEGAASRRLRPRRPSAQPLSRNKCAKQVHIKLL